jgi:hypothetical protein
MITRRTRLIIRSKKRNRIEPQIWAARSIAEVFDKLGLHYERTLKSQCTLLY